MSFPKEFTPPQPPVPEGGVPTAAPVIDEASGKGRLPGEESPKPATQQLAAFAHGAGEVKAAAQKAITATADNVAAIVGKPNAPIPRSVMSPMTPRKAWLWKLT